MKVGLILPMASGDPERVLGFASRAEELGFDGLFAFDHFFPPGQPADRPSLESYATLSVVASATSRIAVGTLITRASLRSAGLLAKQVVTLDDISGGRFVLGIGTGDAVSRAEHEAFGLPYMAPTERREHLVETVRAVKALFGGVPWEGGERVAAVSGPVLPGPRSEGGPPVWIGGTSEGAVRAAAREADGWNGWGLSVEGFGRRAELLRTVRGDRAVEPTWGGSVVVGAKAPEALRMSRVRSERGLGPDAWTGDTEGLLAFLEGLEAVGATWAVLLAVGAPGRMELIGQAVLPQLRARR